MTLFQHKYPCFLFSPARLHFGSLTCPHQRMLLRLGVGVSIVECVFSKQGIRSMKSVQYAQYTVVCIKPQGETKDDQMIQLQLKYKPTTISSLNNQRGICITKVSSPPTMCLPNFHLLYVHLKIWQWQFPLLPV